MENHQESFGVLASPEVHTSGRSVAALRATVVLLISSVLTAGGGCGGYNKLELKLPPPRVMTPAERIKQREHDTWIALCKKMYDKGYHMYFTTVDGEFLITERPKERAEYSYVLEVYERDFDLYKMVDGKEVLDGTYATADEVFERIPPVPDTSQTIESSESQLVPKLARAKKSSALPARQEPQQTEFPE